MRRAFENSGKLLEEFVAGWQQVGAIEWPKPKGAPVVHGELQSLVWARLASSGVNGALEDLTTLVRSEPLAAFDEHRVRLLPKDGEHVCCISPGLFQIFGVLLP